MSEPIFKSYGEFRGNGIFDWLFPPKEFDENQTEAARQIVTQVLRHCDYDGSQKFPPIKTIVDFGCGDGSLLSKIRIALKEAINERNKKKTPNKEDEKWPVRFIGVDQCKGMIKYANKLADNLAEELEEKELQFVLVESGEFLYAKTKILEGLDWSSTALLCLGHTWFHILDQEQLLNQINENRPALLLVDVSQSWDQVVDKLLSKDYSLPEGSVYDLTVNLNGEPDPLKLLPIFRDEETRVKSEKIGGKTKHVVYSLRTQLIEITDETRQVVRGIYSYDAGEKSGRWVFATRQVAKLTEQLRPPNGVKRTHDRGTLSLTEAGEILRLTAEAGEITGKGEGKGKCNYLVLREFEHDSGWGKMNCIAFGALSSMAHSLNEAYFEAVRDLVDYIFVSDSNLLEKNQRPAIEGLRKIIEIFGTGLVEVIMPFDPLRDFARMVPLTSSQVNSPVRKTLSTTDLILEQPNRQQNRFPTGYGLYHTMLDLVSSPVAFTLSHVPGYEKALVDLAFEVLERQFLKASKMAADSAKPESVPVNTGNTGNNVSERTVSSYFMIPFYYGSLPLFTLALEEPNDFPANATNGQVYFSLAQNLDRQLHVIVGEDLIRGRVITPFIKATLEAHLKKAGTRTPLYPTTSENVEIQTEMKDAIIKVKKEINIPDEINKAMNKGWKSWVTALPSHRLISLDGTAFQNDRLKVLATDEYDRFGRDAVSQISAWFQVYEYFCADHNAHDKFLCNVHRGKLIGLIKAACCSDDGGLLTSSYFKEVATEFSGKNKTILIFADRLVTDMLQECIEPVVDGRCQNNPNKDKSFQIAKRLFCRGLENRGLFRFSFSRLYAFVMAYSGALLVRTPAGFSDQFEINTVSWESFINDWYALYDWETNKKKAGRKLKLGKYHATNVKDNGADDPIAEIAFCMAFLNVPDPECTIKIDPVTYDVAGSMSIIAHTNKPIDSRTGSDLLHFRKILEKRGNPVTKDKKDWKITVNAALKETGFEVTWKMT
jgi:hypothetical protein